MKTFIQAIQERDLNAIQTYFLEYVNDWVTWGSFCGHHNITDFEQQKIVYVLFAALNKATSTIIKLEKQFTNLTTGTKSCTTKYVIK